jgi:hypothetical protein
MTAFEILDQFTFHHALAATRGLALVFVTREGWGSCRHWRRVLDEYRVAHPHGARVFEVDAERDAALTHEFGVFHLPALLLYRDGHFHAALRVEAHPHKLQGAIEAALAAPAEELP